MKERQSKVFNLMNKCNITVIGTIGSGKTTFIKYLNEELRKISNNVIVKLEPSVDVSFVNNVLDKFYKDGNNWAYPLQLLIASTQYSYMNELENSEYDFSIMDMAFSSEIYGYSHLLNGRINLEQFNVLQSIEKYFKFDYVIWLDETIENTITHIKNRNQEVVEKSLKINQNDLVIDDFSYIDSHINEFRKYFPIYIDKFKIMNPNVKILHLREIPNKNSNETEYLELVSNIAKEIANGR